MSKDKQTVRPSFERPFVAAFTNAAGGFDPDYVHPNYELTGEAGNGGAPYRWCVRFGAIEIPWGLGEDETGGFKTHGKFYVNRARLDGAAFLGKGFEFEHRGSISYLYECELIDGAFRGFAVQVRGELLPHIRALALREGRENFETALRSVGASDDPDCVAIASILKAYSLKLDRVSLKIVPAGNKDD